MTSGTPKHECTDDDFESCPPRAGTGCFKYDSWEKGVIPLCVADMDVRCSQEILDTLAARVEHGVLGYGHETAALTQAALGWLKRQYDWDVAPEWLVWFPGIVSGMNVFLRAVGRLHAADSEVAAMVHVPAYPPFLTAPEQQRLRLVKVPLRCTSVEGKEQELHYEIDWEVFEQSVDAACRCYILCNPHNPTGRQWTDAELRELAAFCERHGLYVLSDEIWADLVLEGAHTPFAKLVAGTPLAARVVTTMAPSKTFNIAGLGCSLGIIPNAALRAQFVAAAAGIVPHINCLGLAAAETAWGGACDAWHAGLLAHLRRNLALVARASAGRTRRPPSSSGSTRARPTRPASARTTSSRGSRASTTSASPTARTTASPAGSASTLAAPQKHSSPPSQSLKRLSAGLNEKWLLFDVCV